MVGRASPLQRRVNLDADRFVGAEDRSSVTMYSRHVCYRYGLNSDKERNLTDVGASATGRAINKESI